MATTLRNDAKHEIINILRKQGYPTYARLVDLFDIFLTDDPNVVGYMIPGKAKIVLNQNLSINQVSTIVRHEILHEYLTHGPRQQAFDKAHPEFNPEFGGDVSNIAADFEISNRGYTDADKTIARAIKLGDKVLQGLVTEDQYPDWKDMTYEEMYQKLLEKQKQDTDALKNLMKQLSELSQKDLDDMMQDADQMSDDSNSQPQSGQQMPSNGSSSDKQSDKNQDGSSPSDGEDRDGTEEKADNIKKAIQKAKDDLANAEGEAEKSETVFDTDKEQRDKADVAARAEKIRDALNSLKEQQAAQSEATSAIQKEKAARAARDLDRYQGSGLQQFKLNLNRFIADQVGEMEDDSYARIHPSYEDGEFIVPGKLVREEKNIPVINVYHDNSGSFHSEAKTAAAMKAIESLNQYVRDGDIEVKLYYFGNRVSDTRSGTGGGTDGTPILDHIEMTKPTNVIVITDSDISDCSRVVKVPGAVWMLFYDARSQNLMDHLRGKRQNKYYDIQY